MRCPTCLRDLDPQNTDLVSFAQESWSSDLSPLSGNIMDDQQQRRFRAAYLYYARWYEQERFEVWQQRQQCYQARREEFRASVHQQFALIRAELQAVESVLQEVLAAQAAPLHSLDQQLAKLNVEPPPEQIPHRHFIGKRSLSGKSGSSSPAGSEATTMFAGITEFSRPWRKPMSTCAMKQRRKRQSERREKPSGWCVGWESD